MKLKRVYDNKADIPAGYESLFTEQGGKFVLTGVEGLKTQEDIDKIQSALEKERNDHKEAKAKLKAFGDIDPNDIHSKLDRLAELEVAVEKGDDKEKIEKLVEARVNTIKNPLEREIAKLKSDNETLSSENGTLKADGIRRTKADAIRSAAVAAKVLPEALDDIIAITDGHFDVVDGKVITTEKSPLGAGVDPSTYFTEIAPKKAFWFPRSEGGGATGSGAGSSGVNPFTKAGWNITKQGELVRADPSKAEAMAKAAGIEIGATAPVR